MIIYHVNSDTYKKTNITIRFYTGIGISGYKNGIFYACIYDVNGKNIIAYEGNIKHLHNINIPRNTKLIRRKQILIEYDNKPLDIDLCFLDKFWIASKHYPNAIKNLDKILHLTNVKYDYMYIIKNFPFHRMAVNPTMMTIDDIYE